MILILLFLAAAVSCGKEEQIQPAKKPSSGLYAVPALPDADSPCTLYYKADAGSPFYGFQGELYAHIGIVESEWKFVQAEWNENIEKCRFQACTEKNLWQLSITPSVREWFSAGESAVERIGVVVRNSDGTKQTADLFVAVHDGKYAFEPDPVVTETMPAGLHHGINYGSDGSVTLVLRDLDTEGGCHSWCYVTGDFSSWQRSSDYAMKRDETAGCWWYTFTGVDPDREYMFQYCLGKEDGSMVRIHDPYTEIVYDGSNDRYISSSTCPGLPEYPSGTSGLVSAFKVNGDGYQWKTDGFRIGDPDNLVIYEMHLRDFTSTGDIPGALEKLDYISSLGVGAVELMPVQEFDGNDSWGYNPCSYFALDKAYGTRAMYKNFIDECHSRGLAVILDVVYNQATGAHPYAKLYWDASANRTAENNPWFNVEAPHPYSVFHDWNHENPLVRAHVKASLEYLLEEYRVDGFRFDLTKGFTNRKCDESNVSDYDRSRIDILKDYISAVKASNADAVVILEHFCATAEEKELAGAGAKLWRNLNYAYCQSAMGISSGSGFDALWTGAAMPWGSYVGYMESHDEERTAYKSSAYGAAGVKGSLAARMKREALNAAFFLTVPGPKMLWQFEELGYDISIDQNGRTGRKPVHWDYLDDPDRKTLRETYVSLLDFRRRNPEFFSEGCDFNWYVSDASWDDGRFIFCTAEGRSFAVIGNFSAEAAYITAWLPQSGTWKDWPAFGSSSYAVSTDSYGHNSLTLRLEPGDFRLITLE